MDFGDLFPKSWRPENCCGITELGWPSSRNDKGAAPRYARVMAAIHPKSNIAQAVGAKSVASLRGFKLTGAWFWRSFMAWFMWIAAFSSCNSPADSPFSGRWRDPAGTCYIYSLTVSLDPSGVAQIEYLTRHGSKTAVAQLIDGELRFSLASGIEGRLYLNGERELRLYRVFAKGSPEEDIDWKFYRP